MQIGHEEKVEKVEESGILMVQEAPLKFEEKQAKIRQQMLDCFHHHQEILNYCNAFLAAFGHLIFVQLCLFLLVLCFTLFQCIMTAQGNILEFSNAFLYYIVIILDVWCLCYSGNEFLYAVNSYFPTI